MDKTLSVIKLKNDGLYWNYESGFTEPTAETASSLTDLEVQKIKFNFYRLDLVVEPIN